jgi:hypothetical protein
MAGYMGSNKGRFLDLYDSHVDSLLLKFFEYIKLLQPSSAHLSRSSEVQIARPDLVVSTKDGYPWLPPVNDNHDQIKDELEKLLRKYLIDHYSK